MTQPWTERIGGAADAPQRLFVFPFAGGGSVPYRPWGKLFPDTVRVDFVMLPGRESRFRESAYTAMAPLVADLSAALAPELDRPFSFFGHSMGAAIAFELAQRRKVQGLTGPRRLFASGRRAPGWSRLTPVIHHLPDDQFLAALARLGGTPKEVLENRELMELMLPVLRADFTVSDTHAPATAPKLDCPVSVFGGTRDPEADEAALEGWREVTDGPVEIVVHEGGHFFLNAARDDIIRHILSRLEQPALG